MARLNETELIAKLDDIFDEYTRIRPVTVKVKRGSRTYNGGFPTVTYHRRNLLYPKLLALIEEAQTQIGPLSAITAYLKRRKRIC